MEDRQVYQIVLTLLILVGVLVLYYVSGRALGRYARLREIGEPRARMVRKLVRLTFLALALLAVALVWGIDVRNLWLFFTGLFGIIAIGFFAVWSILSNIVAGLILFVTDAFRVDDEIEVLPDHIGGRVVELKLMFVVLEDEQGNIFHVPTNLLFQRFIKKKAPGRAKAAERLPEITD